MKAIHRVCRLVKVQARDPLNTAVLIMAMVRAPTAAVWFMDWN